MPSLRHHLAPDAHPPSPLIHLHHHPQVGQETFRLCRQLVDGIVLVDNSATSAAIKDVFNETRSILEPAGALSVAGAKAWLKRNNIKGGWAWREAALFSGYVSLVVL